MALLTAIQQMLYFSTHKLMYHTIKVCLFLTNLLFLEVLDLVFILEKYKNAI